MSDEPESYTLVIRSLPSAVPTPIRLRKVLKTLLRVFSFRCVSVRPKEDAVTVLGECAMPTNVSKLVCHKAALLMVPPGGGIGTAIQSIVSGRMSGAMREAQEWVKQAIAVVRTAAEPNPWKTADDEAIAGEILIKLEERKALARLTSVVEIHPKTPAAEVRKGTDE